MASPGFPGRSRTKKTGKISKISTFYEKSENRNFSGNRNFRVGGTRPEGPVKSADLACARVIVGLTPASVLRRVIKGVSQFKAFHGRGVLRQQIEYEKERNAAGEC